MATIGILALQGAVRPHQTLLMSLGYDVRLVRRDRDWVGLHGLVLPGGESSVQRLLLHRLGWVSRLRAFVEAGMPVLATCAGLVLLAREIDGRSQPSLTQTTAIAPLLGVLDMTVSRNGWGRQAQSGESRCDCGTLHMVMIRAPRILRCGPDIHVLHRWQGEAVVVQQGNVVAATCHPELVGDAGLYGIFECSDASLVRKMEGRQATGVF